MERALRVDDYSDARRVRSELADLGEAWRYMTGEALKVGLEEVVGYDRSRAALRRIELPRDVWRFPLPPRDRALPEERAERAAVASLLRDRGSWYRRASHLASKAFEALHTVASGHRVMLYLPRSERVEVEGVAVEVEPMPEAQADRAVRVLGEALRLLRRQGRVPWLVARLPPLRLVQDCGLAAGSPYYGSFNVPSRTVKLCAPWLAGATPQRAAFVIAHEAGHHLWLTSLSADATEAWGGMVRGAVRDVDAREVLARWPEDVPLDGFVARLAEIDPELHLAFKGALEHGDLRGVRSRGALSARGERGPLRLTASPVSVYAAKSEEEAFCEALGLLAAYGPRTLLPEVAQWLRAVVPTVRPKANGGTVSRSTRKHNRGDAPGPLATFANAEDLERAMRYAPSLRGNVEDVVARLLSAGAKPPFTYLGAGGYGFVVCDARGVGFKAARDMRLARSLADEAEWLRIANTAPEIRDHVARFYAWHPREAVIERECVRPKRGDLVRHRGKGDKLWATHELLRRVMLGYGWTQPEFKEDSYVITRDRGPVLVDAGLVARVGSALAREVAELHRRPDASDFDRQMARGSIRLELDRTIPRGPGQRLHDRLAAKGNGRKSNSAVARRAESRPVVDLGKDEWGYETRAYRVDHVETPAHVTEGHWQEPEVVEAARIAAKTQQGYDKHLGDGNFGVTYRVETPDGTRVVKVPAAYNMHRQPWTRAEQSRNLLHEAGVANELAALGYGAVPRGVYTEWGGGTPAFVREYGEPVTSITPAEYAEIERQLLSIERDHRWRVEDDLQLYRRADGSLFVGDVGIWQAPSIHTQKWSARDSSLDTKLARVQQQLLPELPWREKRTAVAGYEYADRVPMATAARLVDTARDIAETLAELREEGDARYAGKAGQFLLQHDSKQAEGYLRALSDREAFGVPTLLPELSEGAVSARAVLERIAGAAQGAKPNGAHRRRGA